MLLGIAWGGLMWSRPDSFVYVGGVSAGYLLYVALSDRSRLQATLQGMVKAGLIGALIYAPWLLGTNPAIRLGVSGVQVLVYCSF